MTIYIFPMFSNIMRNSLWIWVAIFSLLCFAIVIASIDFASGQVLTNSTPVVILPSAATTANQAVATDPISLISIIVTTIGIPAIGYFLSRKDDKTKEIAKEGHNQNEFRLEATTEAVKEMNNSLKATDAGNLEFAKIVQALFKPFKENETLKKAYANYTINGTPVLQALDEYIADSQVDLVEYYNGTNNKEDRFDTCNDPIVQKLTAVR